MNMKRFFEKHGRRVFVVGALLLLTLGPLVFARNWFERIAVLIVMSPSYYLAVKSWGLFFNHKEI